MRIEERLGRALHDEADAREVDVPLLHERVRSRVATGPAPCAVRRPARRSSAPLLLAAAVVAVVVAVTGVSLLGSPPSVPGPATGGVPAPVEGGIADTFTCPATTTYDWTRPETVTNDYVAASLLGGPEAQARTHEAARYDYREDGDRAYLRFGNADGSLATLSEFTRAGDAWVRRRTEVCTGADGSVAVPVDAPFTLGRKGTTPYPARDLSAYRASGESVLLDHRDYYDGIGLVRHRSMYATPCARRLCVTAGDPGAHTTLRSQPHDGLPHDSTFLFLPLDHMVERRNPYGFWLLWDTEGGVEEASVELRDGTVLPAQRFRGDGWSGTLHALVAPYDEVEAVMVDEAGGETVRYRPEELPGYEARLHR